MKVFTRDDGRTLRVVDGFRNRVLSASRVSVPPKPEWSRDYKAAAETKVQRSEQFSYKGGVVDIPWAHARLTAAEYYRFVASNEGERRAAKRLQRLQTLNQLSPRQWRRTLEAGLFEILQWDRETSPMAETLLEEHPDVRETFLDGVEVADLTCSQIKVCMGNNATSAS
jgi:hypothetical protein